MITCTLADLIPLKKGHFSGNKEKMLTACKSSMFKKLINCEKDIFLILFIMSIIRKNENPKSLYRVSCMLC